jgi:hypothetical protein
LFALCFFSFTFFFKNILGFHTKKSLFWEKENGEQTIQKQIQFRASSKLDYLL